MNQLNLSNIVLNTSDIHASTIRVSYKDMMCDSINSYYLEFVNYSFYIILVASIFIILSKFFKIIIPRIKIILYKTNNKFLQYFLEFDTKTETNLFEYLAKLTETILWFRIVVLFLIAKGF